MATLRRRVASMYRRILRSPPAIDFVSNEGKKLFRDAIQAGTMECFFKLISNFQTQSEPAYCGLASISMVLNSLSIDPKRNWKGQWRWFDESMLDWLEPLHKVKAEGTSFGKLVCLAQCAGADVQAFRTTQTTVDQFRQFVKQCSASDGCHVVSSYHRAKLNQIGTGHFSPLGGYHEASDMVLILDVARFKYPPHWVPLSLLWEAMNTTDEKTGLRRGFMMISKPQSDPGLLHILSCRAESWRGSAKSLVDDVPLLLKSEDAKDIDKVIGIVCKFLPSDFEKFIQWVTEVRWTKGGGFRIGREEKGRLVIKNEVLKQVQDTGLHKYVVKFLSSTTCCTRLPSPNDKKDFQNIVKLQQPSGSNMLTILLLALPSETWYGIRDENLLRELNGLVSTDNLHPLLQEEVLHFRRQLHLLTTTSPTTS